MLRPFQAQALEALAGPGPRHVICVAPTGAGKSLIYERVAAEPGRRTLLITPLIALARQQEARLQAQGVRTFRHAREAGRGAGTWITSPEALLLPAGQRALRDWRPDFWVIDECHCLWEWGEGFRPAFSRVASLLILHRPRRSLWLTATLSPVSREKLVTGLRELGHEPAQLGEFGLPPRLRLEARRIAPAARLEALVAAVASARGAGLVFANTRETCERLARVLSNSRRSVAYYHAGLSREERVAIESRLRAGELDCVVATSAFGMGIDVARLRWVAMWQPPPSLLALAQAVGRAGRDAEVEARALVLWDDADFAALERRADEAPGRAHDLRELREFLLSTDCRARELARRFRASINDRCGKCDRCRAAP
jgi:ATP-dependent DNA helicase RecQ